MPHAARKSTTCLCDARPEGRFVPVRDDPTWPLSRSSALSTLSVSQLRTVGSCFFQAQGLALEVSREPLAEPVGIRIAFTGTGRKPVAYPLGSLALHLIVVLACLRVDGLLPALRHLGLAGSGKHPGGVWRVKARAPWGCTLAEGCRLCPRSAAGPAALRSGSIRQ